MMMLVPGRENALVLEARDAGVNEMVQIPLTGENFCHRMVALFDRPRHFITAEHYKGPCRRLRPAAPPQAERRIRDVRIVPFQEAMA